MTEKKTNQVAQATPKAKTFAALSPSQQREFLLTKSFETAEASEFKYTEEGKRCATNAVIGVQSVLAQKGMTLNDIDLAQLAFSIHAVAATELNMAAIPSECYVDIHGKVVTIKPQGAGNEKLVSRFGRDLKTLHRAWVIHDGDEFTLPQFDGLTTTNPKWTPKNTHGKVLMVVYPAEMKDGSVEWLIADRSSVIENVVAQCRQNALYAFKKKGADGTYIDKFGKPTSNPNYAAVDAVARDKYYNELNAAAEKANGDLDKFLADPLVAKYINPTYTSYGSKEAMIERKMKNNALKRFPRDFANEVLAEAANAIREDRDESLEDQKPQPKRDVIEQVEEETKALPKGDAVPDFDVDDDTGEVKMADEPKPTEPSEPEVEKARDYGDLL